jgi:hypothetical protein
MEDAGVEGKPILRPNFEEYVMKTRKLFMRLKTDFIGTL